MGIYYIIIKDKKGFLLPIIFFKNMARTILIIVNDRNMILSYNFLFHLARPHPCVGDIEPQPKFPTNSLSQ